MRKNTFLFVIAAICVFSLCFVCSCGKIEITCDEAAVSLSVGDSHTISYSVTNTTPSFQYSSSNAAVADVDADGLITGLSEGSATITVVITGSDKKATSATFNIPVTVEETRKVNVTLDLDGGSGAQASNTIKYGTTFTLPTLTKEGYAFLGWTKVKGATDYIKELANVVADAKAYANFELLKYAVTYELDGATYEGAEEVEWGKDVELGTPVKAGYNFVGWYVGEDKVEKLEAVKADVTVTAKFEVIKHTITYTLNDGTNDDANPAEFTELEEVVLKDATKEGYSFDGWYVGEDKVEKIEAGTTADVTLEAKFTALVYAITYELNGGVNDDANPAEINHGEEITLQPAVKAGYDFVGWYNGEEAVEKLTGAADVTLTAKYSLHISKISYDTGNDLLTPIADEYCEDFRSTGAYSASNVTDASQIDSGKIDSSAVVAMMKDADLTAKWSWLYDAIYEIAGSPAGYNYTEIDWESPAFGEKGFWLVNLHAALCGTSFKDNAFGQSYAFNKHSLDDAISANSSKLPQIAEEYCEDFRSTGAYSASNVTDASQIDSGKIDSSAVVAMMKDVDLTAKWAWLYDAIYLAAGSPEGYNYTEIDWESPAFGEKGFWLVNLHAALCGTSFKDNAFGQSYAFEADSLDDAIAAHESGENPIDAIAVEYCEDFRSTGAATASNVTDASQIDSGKIDSSAVVAMMKDVDLTAKWAWLYDAIYLAAGSPEGYNYTEIDWESPAFGEKGFWLVNLHAALCGESFKDNAFGQSYAFTKSTLNDAISAKNGQPKSYYLGQDCEITYTPAVPSGATFEGWYVNGKKITNTNQLDGADAILVAKFTYKLTLDAGEGTLEVGYKDLDAVATDFMADWNATTALSLTGADQLDTNYIGSSKMDVFMTNADMVAKWQWLLDAIYELAGSPEGKNYTDCEWTSDSNNRGFWLANIAGALTGTQHTDTWLGTVSAEYTANSLDDAIAATGAPTTYEVGADYDLSKLVPTAEGKTFAGWFNGEDEVTNLSELEGGDVTLVAKYIA